MNPSILYENEAEDADIVDKAEGEISLGNIDLAKSLLLCVTQNTPANYSSSEEFDDVIYIKFWHKEDFFHYINWQKEHGLDNKNIEWFSNVYPRAYYLLGYIYIQEQQYARAIDYLDVGLILEPNNPKIINEKAMALSLLGEMELALSLYELNTNIDPFVTPLDSAKALRGKGFVHIELGDLSSAKNAYVQSLKIEPENNTALNQLSYIDHILNGGSTSKPEVVRALPAKIRSIIKKIL